MQIAFILLCGVSLLPAAMAQEPYAEPISIDAGAKTPPFPRF